MSAVPKTMKALVYEAPGELRLAERAMPEIGEEDVLIRVVSCGICGSDVPGYLGKTGRRIPPMVMGHEFSGIIAGLGAKVKDLTLGQRVTAQPIRFCGKCAFCKQGKTSLCSDQTMLGVLRTDGAMAEYVKAAAKQIVPLPEDVSFDTAALAEPFAVAYSAVLKADVAGRAVAVVGTGTIGLMIVAALRMRGAGRIYAMDLDEEKRDFALSMGADVVFDPRDGSAFEAMLDETGGGVDVAFEAVGAAASVDSAMRSLKKAGTAVWVGNMMPDIQLNMQRVVTRELQIKGNFDYTQQSFAETVRNMGRFDFSRMIDRVVCLEDAAEVFQKLGSREISSIKTIIHIGGESHEEV